MELQRQSSYLFGPFPPEENQQQQQQSQPNHLDQQHLQKDEQQWSFPNNPDDPYQQQQPQSQLMGEKADWNERVRFLLILLD